MDNTLQEAGAQSSPELAGAAAEAAFRYSPTQIETEIRRVKRRRIVTRLLVAVVVIAVIAVAVLAFSLYGAVYTIEDDAMAPRLAQGDAVVVRPVDEPADNDIIAYRNAEGAIEFKRVVAVPGEWVNVVSNGTFVVSDSPLDEDAISGLVAEGATLLDSQQLPAGVYFVKADTVTETTDALADPDNLIIATQIVGNVRFGLWPPAKFGPVA